MVYDCILVGNERQEGSTKRGGLSTGLDVGSEGRLTARLSAGVSARYLNSLEVL